MAKLLSICLLKAYNAAMALTNGSPRTAKLTGAFLAILAFIAGACPGWAETQLTKISDSVIDTRALHFTEGTWGTCVNGQTFQQDAISSFAGFQYATYYDSDRKLCVARRQLAAQNWEIIRFPDYVFKGNDTHNVAVLGICAKDGTIHLAFDHHGHPLHYRVSRHGAATDPQKVKWAPELFSPVRQDLEPGKPLTRVTYPRFIRSPSGGLQFSCRIGGSGNGDKCLADYDPISGTWSRFGGFIDGKGAYMKSASRNAYLNGLNYDGKGRLHATWCWRETGNPMTNHDLLYAWSSDAGQTWLNNAGAKIGRLGQQPVSLSSPGLGVVAIEMNRGLINATTQAVDNRNRIHLATFHLPDETPAQGTWEATRKLARYFHYWRDDSGKWHRNRMDFIGSRPQLWFDAQDNAYLVFVGDRFNPSPCLSIARATAKSRWRNWEIICSEQGPFSGQPRIDQHLGPGLLSVYIQEAPKGPERISSSLKVFTYKAGEE